MLATSTISPGRHLPLLIVGVLILIVAVAIRLPRLDVPTNNYDAGIYLESSLLMPDGYRPFCDIVATQGPLHLYLAYPAYALGGRILTAARLGAVAGSMLGVRGVMIAGLARAPGSGFEPWIMTKDATCISESLSELTDRAAPKRPWIALCNSRASGAPS